MLNNQRLNVLKKILNSGYTNEKEISSISIKEIPELCRNIGEVSDIILLQKAIKANKLIPYLSGDFNNVEKKNEE